MNNNRQPNNGRPNVPPQGQQNRQTQGRPTQNGRNSQTTGQSMNRIKDQTPTQRRATKSEVKLTHEQIEINRVNRQRERYYIKKRRNARLKTFGARFLLFLAVFALMAAIVGGIFMLVLTSAPEDKSSSYSYSIGDNEYSLPSSQAVRDGEIYVSFTDVAAMCDLAITGSNEDMKYVIKGDEAETIRFVTDSRVVYVNGVETRLSANCYFKDKELYVPVEFVSAYVSGINVEVDEGSHTVKIERIVTNLGENGKLPKGEDPIYAELSFLLQSAVGLEPLDEEAEALAELPDLGFVSNLAAYEEYMNPGNTDEFLTLVNINNKLGADHIPQDLTSVVDTRQDGRETQMLRKNAAMSLEAMFKELRAAGYEDVSVTSAYRSYSYQEYLFNMYLAQYNNDYDYVASFSNPPGSSEHQTGLCADLHNLPGADKSFANEAAYTWLKENCWKFGFILRYPEDKTEVTGISFEPWHYRYVGRYHAQKMYQMNMCLEEYLEYISAGN
ncbi:MAG: D-alanyl-D-alanine carboxypeptidase family protein [Clostridia bacterium]|nr:D-alanyl-D-alanine carboxypeptidase family protein [Clostridia bacterium]